MCHVKRMKGGRQCQQLCGTLQCATLERMANRTVEIPRRWERFVDHAPSTQRSFSLSTDETKVLNKVHQCVLFTKAKRRCHNLTHTLHAHTLPLTDSTTHTDMQSGACITLSGARREFRIYATMLPTRPDDTSAQRECLCHSLFLCLRHCLCVFV